MPENKKVALFQEMMIKQFFLVKISELYKKLGAIESTDISSLIKRHFRVFSDFYFFTILIWLKLTNLDANGIKRSATLWASNILRYFSRILYARWAARDVLFLL